MHPQIQLWSLMEAAGIDIGEVRDIICCKFTRLPKVDEPEI
jgi:hypothetical protein